MKNLFLNSRCNTLRLSIKLFAITCFLVICLCASNALAQWPAVDPCSAGSCDKVVLHDTPALNCFRFRITNVGMTDKMSIFRLMTNPASGATLHWICSVSTDTTGLNANQFSANAYPGPMLPNTWQKIGAPLHYNDVFDAFDQFYQDNTGGTATNSLATAHPFCDSGFITICFCCLDNKSTINFPLTIRTYHTAATFPYAITDSCDNSFTLPIAPASCPITWACDSACDGLTIDGPTIGPAGEINFCATIKQLTSGELRNFSLNFDCLSGGANSDMLDWRVKSMPPGWYNSSTGTSGATFVDTTTITGPAATNCSSTTICFVAGGCGTKYCDHVKVTLTSPGQTDTCNVSQTMIIPFSPAHTNNACCSANPTTAVTTPTQNTNTGVWTMCVVVHRTDGLNMSNITICHTNQRCITLDNVPDGWKLASTSTVGGTTCDVFSRTSASNTGCRTFKFCYKTCDCDQSPYSITWTISGDNLSSPPTTLIWNVTIPGDGGNCCYGKWYRRDDVQVSYDPTHANCLTFTLLNSHSPCSNLNDFHFTAPVGCAITSVTVPTGFTGSWTGTQVDVVPAAISPGVISCPCGTMVVVVCFDCTGPFYSFSTHWRSTLNGTTVTDSVQYINPGPVMHPLDVKTGSVMPHSEPNYPNPFGAPEFKTTIPFVTDGTGVAQITISDATGKVVLNDDLEISDAGKHFFYFTGKELPAGTYFYRIYFPKGKRIIVNRTMILVK